MTDIRTKVEDAKAEGWKVKKHESDRVIMQRSGSLGGHLFVFLLFGWWTLGLANLIYAYYMRGKTKVVRGDD